MKKINSPIIVIYFRPEKYSTKSIAFKRYKTMPILMIIAEIAD